MVSRATGASYPAVSDAIVRDSTIPLPPLREQQRIAGILDKADAIMRKRQQAIELTEQFLRSTFLDMFGESIVKTLSNKSLAGWQGSTVAGIAADKPRACVGGPFGSDLTRKDYVEKPGIPVIRGLNLASKSPFMDEREFVYVSEKKGKALDKNAAHRGDVMVSQRGARLAGQVAIIPVDSKFEKYIVSQSQMKVTVDKDKVLPIYFLYYLRSQVGVRMMEERTISTGVPHINLGILRNFPVPVPPIELQTKFKSIRQKQCVAHERCVRLAEESHNLFNSLVQRAFRGEL